MTLFLELWKPKPRWLELSEEERAEYIRSIEPSIERLLGAGVELVGIGTNDEETDHRADYRFWAVWRMPEELVGRFESAVREDGFYDYFDQVNARGVSRPVEEVLGQLVKL